MAINGNLFSPKNNLANAGNNIIGQFENTDYQVKTCDDLTILFKGIIYDIKGYDLKKDDEVLDTILHVYRDEGYEGFIRLNGKSTIIIFENDKTIVFRDHWGEGPMFFFDTKNFADDIKKLIENKKDIEINKSSLNTFLKFGFIPAPLTIINTIYKLPAGNVAIFNGSGVTNLINLFHYEEFKSGNRNIKLEEAAEEYERLLKTSLKRRIKGAETVGTLLSGGYDSGGNIAFLREVFGGEIKSYSIGFKDNPYSELPYAKLMAEKFGASHSEYLMDEPDIQFLPNAIKAFGEPFSESGFMLNNAAMKLVKDEKLPVIIGGDGNDQLFGTTAKELSLNYLIRSYGGRPFQKLANSMMSNSFFEKDDIFFKLRFHNRKIMNVMRPDNFGFNDQQISSIFKLGEVLEHPAFEDIPTKFDGFEDFHDKHNFHLDIRHSINEVILNKASRLSAFYGNNLAFSYLDKDIYDFVKKLPLELRVKGDLKSISKGKGVTKYLHKYVTKPHLPEDVTARKKQGGFSPLAIFFNNGATRQKIYSYILNSDFVTNYADGKNLKLFLDKYEAGARGQEYWFWYKQLASNQLINLLIMSLWWDIYINKSKGETLSDFVK